MAGEQTCVMVPELDLMFDVGGFVPGALRYRTILVTHGHQDHLGGLPYLASQRQLNGLAGPGVHVPREVVDPMERIFAAWSEIEDFLVPIDLMGHDPGDRFDLPRGLSATCVRSVHRVPSLAWIVERHSKRLKPELRGLEGPAIAERRAAGHP